MQRTRRAVQAVVVLMALCSVSPALTSFARADSPSNRIQLRSGAGNECDILATSPLRLSLPADVSGDLVNLRRVSQPEVSGLVVLDAGLKPVYGYFKTSEGTRTIFEGLGLSSGDLRPGRFHVLRIGVLNPKTDYLRTSGRSLSCVFQERLNVVAEMGAERGLGTRSWLRDYHALSANNLLVEGVAIAAPVGPATGALASCSGDPAACHLDCEHASPSMRPFLAAGVSTGNGVQFTRTSQPKRRSTRSSGCVIAAPTASITEKYLWVSLPEGAKAGAPQ